MIGIILRQRYKIVKKLGIGGIGETYLAEDVDIPASPKPKCVVKRLQPQEIDADIQRLFELEAKTLYLLGKKHDQIPTLHAYFEENGEFYLVQELIEGHDLSQEIYAGKQWTEAEVIKFLQELLEVLAFVHQNDVIHRDIKPSNIMRRRHDGKLILIDFGIVKEVSSLVVNAQGQTVSTINIGTPGYKPSEQAQGRPRFSSDVYALGKVAIQALTGIGFAIDLPEDNDGEVIWRDRVQVSDALAEILNKMVRYDFRQRYQTAAEALQALNLTVVPPPVTPLKPFVIDNKWGYKDERGQVVIPPQFDRAEKFAEGLARVQIDSKWGYIDQVGQLAISPQFDYAQDFSEGMAGVPIGSQYGYIDKTGKIIILPQFDEVGNFSEGLAAANVYSKYGYIDKTGQWVISPQFDQVENFSEGLAKVYYCEYSNYEYENNYGTYLKKVNWKYINKNGQPINQYQWDTDLKFSEGMAAVKIDDKYGYIDKVGRIVIRPQFYQALNFSEGLAAVKVVTKWLGIPSGFKYGYIDKIGQMVISPKFDNVESFSQGQAKVWIDGQERYIDKTGTFIK